MENPKYLIDDIFERDIFIRIMLQRNLDKIYTIKSFILLREYEIGKPEQLQTVFLLLMYSKPWTSSMYVINLCCIYDPNSLRRGLLSN